MTGLHGVVIQSCTVCEHYVVLYDKTTQCLCLVLVSRMTMDQVVAFPSIFHT